jgi:hypothetical protein
MRTVIPSSYPHGGLLLRANSANPYHAGPSHQSPMGATTSRRNSRSKAPATAGYKVAIGIAVVSLFFVLWWAFMSVGEGAPWIPAGLAASVVALLAVGMRQTAVRRSRASRRGLNIEWHEAANEPPKHRSRTLSANSLALRSIQRQSSEADDGNTPEAHLQVFRACKEYLDSTEDMLRIGDMSTESRVALKSGQERVRNMRRHHILKWAKGASRQITHDAQKLSRLSDKLDTALRGLSVIEAARQHYPDAPELVESSLAINEFMVSARVAHWVELAERSAFRGHYQRAIDRYRDALFYLSRGEVGEEMRLDIAERIGREIELMRTRLRTSRGTSEEWSSSQEDRKQDQTQE